MRKVPPSECILKRCKSVGAATVSRDARYALRAGSGLERRLIRVVGAGVVGPSD